VQVSRSAEAALKLILESAERATQTVQEIAQTTVEQATGTNRVADAIGSIAERVQQMAAATAEQARGSEQIMKSAERMRTITQQVERSTQEQTRGSKLIQQAIESITDKVTEINRMQSDQTRQADQLLGNIRDLVGTIDSESGSLRSLSTLFPPRSDPGRSPRLS
jgi:methyl-accepting chemotaxis protein